MKLLPKMLRTLFFLIITIIFIDSGSMFASEIRFTFAPKDGSEFTQTLLMIREKKFGPGTSQIDETLSVTKIICKKTVEGWDIIARPIKSEMKRNGEVVNHPILSLLSTISITYKLNNKGELEDVVGLGKVMESVNSQFPPEFAQKLAPMLNSDTLKRREVAEWNGRIGDYLNKTISIGDIWEYEVPFELPNGVILKYKIKTQFKEQTQCGNSKCILIEQVYDSTAAGMADMANKVIKSVSEGNEELNKKMPTAKEGGSSIKGRVVRIIDPKTMNIYKEETERIMQIEMDVPGQGSIPTTMIEKRSYKFDYR